MLIDSHKMLQFMKTSLNVYLVMLMCVIMIGKLDLLEGCHHMHMFNMCWFVSVHPSGSISEYVHVPLGFVMRFDMALWKSFFFVNMRFTYSYTFEAYVVLLVLWAVALSVFCVKCVWKQYMPQTVMQAVDV